MVNAKWVWITGGSSGIGLATARECLDRGDYVILSARDAQKLQQVCTELNAQLPSPQAFAYALDVTDAQALQQAWEFICGHFALPDWIIFNAGTHTPTSIDSLQPSVFRQLMEVNYFAVLQGIHTVLPRLRAQRRGTIAVVASVAGYRGLPTAAAYGASKAAMIHACEAFYTELQGSGVKLKLINPGFVRTPLTDRNAFAMPCLMEPEAAAKALVKGLESPGFEVVFPRRFAYFLKFLRCLPYAIYFKLVQRLNG